MAEWRRRGDSWAQWHTAAWGRTMDGGARGCAGGRRRRRGGGLAERREARFFPYRTLDEQRRRGSRAGQQQPHRRAQPAKPLLAEQQAEDGIAGAQRPVRARSRRRSRCRGELERRRIPLRNPRLAVGVEDAVAEQVTEDGVPEGGRPPPLAVNRSNPAAPAVNLSNPGEVRKRGGRSRSPASPCPAACLPAFAASAVASPCLAASALLPALAASAAALATSAVAGRRECV
ncbi:uncharacterized protein LOC127760639 [Oryza glaberrima]|uniref:uncharacterized protein LOC127760639 n=1 Tax=Oryza glaberrima TaxID=4538 RepID=UPI00224BF30F|nr:uncharacterized protein LOC127760639 [Oryza glaberrima]